MKNLLSLTFVLSLMLSLNAKAGALNKTFDGRNARCTEKADIGNRAFRLKMVSDVNTSSSKEITMNVEFLKCALVENALKLVASSADEVLTKTIVLANGELSEAHYQLLNFKLVATNQKSDLLAVGQFTDSGKSKHQVRFSISEKNEKQVLIYSSFLEGASSDALPATDPVEFMGGGYIINF